MSTWTMEEVKVLDGKNAGGNEWCRARWFAKLTDSEEARLQPKEGDHLDNYKKFVHLAYEQQKWYDENGKPENPSSGEVSAVAEVKKIASNGSGTPTKKKTPTASNTPSPTRAAASAKDVEEDLLILDFEAKVIVPPTSAAVTSMPQQQQDEWGNFTASSPPKPVEDVWGSFTASTNSPAVKPATSLTDDWAFQAAPPLPASAANSTSSRTTTPPLQFGQPQQPSYFPNPGIVTSFPTNGFQPQQPSSPASAFGFTSSSAQASKPVFAPSPAVSVGPMLGPSKPIIPDDPFAQLHSFNSAPSVMSAAAQTANMKAPNPNMMRSNSAPTANDPFAGLF
jgi:hypothetical protein